MSKIVEFENALCDLITETFQTRKELQEVIDYFNTSTVRDFLEGQMQNTSD